MSTGTSQNEYLSVNSACSHFMEKQTRDASNLQLDECKRMLDRVNEQSNTLSNLLSGEDCTILKYIKEETDVLRKFADRKDVCTLKYVREKTNGLCNLSINHNLLATKYLKQQTTALANLYELQKDIIRKYKEEQDKEFKKFVAKQKHGSDLVIVNNELTEYFKIPITISEFLSLSSQDLDSFTATAMPHNHLLSMKKLHLSLKEKYPYIQKDRQQKASTLKQSLKHCDSLLSDFFEDKIEEDAQFSTTEFIRMSYPKYTLRMILLIVSNQATFDYLDKLNHKHISV